MEFPALFSECPGSGTGKTCMSFNNTFGINICVRILKPLFFFSLVSLLEMNKSFVPLKKHCSVPFSFKSHYVIFLSEEFFSIKHHTVSLFITSFTCYQFQCFFPLICDQINCPKCSAGVRRIHWHLVYHMWLDGRNGKFK